MNSSKMTKVLDIRSAVLTHPGRKRSHNEDFVSFFEPDSHDELAQSGRAYIVADGVGGAAKGERASQYAAQKVLFDYYNDDDPNLADRLVRAMRKAGNEIFDHAEQQEAFTQMATTMVVAVIRGDELIVANVGDSRAYLIRDGEARQITHDHTYAGELLSNGEITEEEVRHIKGKHRITRSIGGHRDVRVDIFNDIHLRSGDRVLLCTDGLTRYASRQTIASFTKEENPEDGVEKAGKYANKKGGADNITVAIIAVGDAIDPAASIIRRGEAPVLIDWETLDTQPPSYVYRKSDRRGTHYKVIRIGALLALLIATVTLAYIVQRRSTSAQEAGNEVSTPEATLSTIVIDSSTPIQDETSSDTAVEEETTDKNLSPPVVPTLALDTEEMSAAIEDLPARPTPISVPLSRDYWDTPKTNEVTRVFEKTKLILTDVTASEDDKNFEWIAPKGDEARNPDNYLLEVKASFKECSSTSDNNKNAFGIVVKSLGDGNALMLEFSCDHTYRLVTYDDYIFDPKASWEDLEEPFLTKASIYEIEVTGNNISLYINYEEINAKLIIPIKFDGPNNETGIYAISRETDGFAITVDSYEITPNE